jgi:hypothetical protein
MCVHILNQSHIDPVEGTMNSNTMLFAAVLMTAVAIPVPGQSAGNPAGGPSAPSVRYTETRVRSIEANYRACLTSANEGVVESAIAQSVKMKWAFPSMQLEDLRGSLGTLATGGKTAAIRYKAYLASLVYDSPSIFAGESEREYAMDEDLINAIGVRAQKALLGNNGDHPRGF